MEEDPEGSADRLLAELAPGGRTVSMYVPARHPAHVRVLNPARDRGLPGSSTWASIVESTTPAVSVLRSDTDWDAFDDVAGRGEQEAEPAMGTIDPAVLVALLRILTDRPESGVVAAQWEGYADAVFPDDAVCRAFPPYERRSWVWLTPHPELLARSRVPMRCWDPGLRWVIGADIYDRGVFVSGSEDVIAEILDCPVLEAYRVAPSDPV